MTPEQQRIALSAALGNLNPRIENGRVIRSAFQSEDGTFFGSGGVPDYLNDLNAMHKAEGVLKNGFGKTNQVGRYIQELNRIGDRDKINPMFATAAQRAEAFLRTTGKWVEP